MQVPAELVQRAIEDLATVRKAIEATGDQETSRPRATAIGTNLVLQLTALVVAAGLLCAELATGHVSSRMLNLSVDYPELRLSSIVIIGLLLLILVGALYFIIYRASRTRQRDFTKFVARNFAYLKNLSLLSDLLVKFAVVALLIHVRQPRWVAPLLFLFIGDYLMQGRFFTLPLRAALALGVLCFAGGLAQAYLGSTLLSWPLGGFIVVCALSVVQMIRLRRADAGGRAAQ